MQCRICLSFSSEQYTNMHAVIDPAAFITYLELFTQITMLDVEDQQQLLLCEACCTKLRDINKFIIMAIDANVCWQQPKTNAEFVAANEPDNSVEQQTTDYLKQLESHNEESSSTDNHESSEEQQGYTCAQCHHICCSEEEMYNHLSCCQNSIQDSIAADAEKISLSNHLESQPVANASQNQQNIAFTCQHCNRQFVSKKIMNRHIRNTHKEKDFVCEICGNAFKLKNHLRNHMKLHIEKNIRCPHCEKTYARAVDLDIHLRSHTGELPYACELCDKKFAIKVRLTYHMQKHLGIKHKCTDCNAEFNSRGKWRAHSFKHTDFWPYRCAKCQNKGFANRNNFKRHLSRTHKITMSEEQLNDIFRQNTGKSIDIQPVALFEDKVDDLLALEYFSDNIYTNIIEEHEIEMATEIEHN